MTARSYSDESVVAAACAALAPYPWRSFTPELVARLVLAARDRQHLHEALLVTVPGASVGAWERLEPAEPVDARLPRLVTFMTANRWTQLKLTTLCSMLLAVLEA